MRFSHRFQHFPAATCFADIEQFIHGAGLEGWSLVTILGDDAEIIVALCKPMVDA